MFGLIDSLGGGELLAVLIMLMVVVGPDRLPEVARKIGKGIAQARGGNFVDVRRGARGG